MTRASWTISGAGVALGGRPIVRDVDVSVNSGEVVALLGANGSGKSTLVKAMVGLHPLSTGSIRLFGEDADRLPAVAPARLRAAALDDRAGRALDGGRDRRAPDGSRGASRSCPMRREDRLAIREALEAVDLADRAHHQVSTLSGGQQQRVLMARTLAGRPELLVLDEPNAGVDLESQQAIANTLGTLTAAGATIVVVLHELGPFADLIQRTLVLREGRLVYDGPPIDPRSPRRTTITTGRPLPPLLRPGVRAPFDGGTT